MTSEAHVDGELNSQDGDRIDIVFSSGCIHLDQAGDDREGNPVENSIIIISKRQAKALIRAIKAMSAANGWKV